MKKYELVWSDEFEGDILDANKWSHELGYVRNHELQYYTDGGHNTLLRDSCLVLQGRRESFEGFDYTSASIHTAGKAEFLYGRIEMRAKLPMGKGIWPAFWTLGADFPEVGWPECGEIDMMELIGGPGDDTIYATLHYPGSSRTEVSHEASLQDGRFHDNFHIFGIDWSREEIRWSVDGIVFCRLDIREKPAFHKKHFVLLNLAIGGDWPGAPDESTVFPQEYIIDWVRCYRQIE